jgi:hypothetical protein
VTPLPAAANFAIEDVDALHTEFVAMGVKIDLNQLT